MVKSLLKAAESGAMKGSDPSVISKTVQKIIRAKKPKTRYLVGAMAKPLVGIRNLFGDNVYDKVILSQVK